MALSASQARASLPYIPYSLALTTPGPLEEIKIKYVHHLVARGDLADIQAHLDALPDDEARVLVDSAIYSTWYGNTLNTAAYWNTGETALAIVAYLVSKGARFVQDYYGEYPWESTGSLYVSPFNGVSVGDRESDEFTETHAALRAQYAPAPSQEPSQEPSQGAGAGAPSAAQQQS